MTVAEADDMSHLLKLPEELIVCILNKLGYENLITVGFVSKSLYHLASMDILWRNFCLEWEGIIKLDEWRRELNSGRALFRLLRSFQKLIGLWSSTELYPRGGILHINWGNLCLIASRVWPRHSGDVILRPLFEVAGLQNGSFKTQLFTQDVDFKFPMKLIWSSKEEVEFEFELCDLGEDSSVVNSRNTDTTYESRSYMPNQPTKLLQLSHLATIVRSLQPDQRLFGAPAHDEFLDENSKLNCEQLLHRFLRPVNQERGTQDQESSTDHERHGGHISHRAIQYLMSMYAFGNQTPGTKIFSGSNRINKSAYTKLIVDEPKPGQELAGLWSGMYGPHGLEIVKVSYTNDEIIANKLLGDPNVPCNEVTFKVKLSSVNMEARLDLQRNLMGIEQDDALDIARTYRGYGRIAGRGFHNPKWVPGQLLVHCNGNMAFLWEDVNFVISFQRLHLESLSSELK
ncbi:hypothetical protein SUGI_0558360 [Cryptomeria japonica]|uniref:putative F-box protein At5g39460 n=1 Tax=Cryptomeria japonica TaxID=3369 RepID=UPI002408E28D|nr:putative F-box protein At5g39460 [Cryptomeria japonica]GLJ28379.1 hypothetical protein SUGI_0558360 [Cryptomeria japonica]